MNQRPSSLYVFGFLALAALPGVSRATVITINRDAVVPVVFDSALTISDSRVGDPFTCHVDNDRDLPPGTILAGRITNIHYPRGNRPASMDLEFMSVQLPNGPSFNIRAIPIPLDKDLMRTGPDGRLYVKNDVRKQGEYVIGGALGGYLLGSLFHRRFTGLLLGTVAGMVAADSDRAHSMNVVVDKNAKMGALFNEDVVIDTAARGRGAWDRGWDGAHGVGSAAPAAPAGGWDATPTPQGPTPPPPIPGTAPAVTAPAANTPPAPGGWDAHRNGGTAAPTPAAPSPAATPTVRDLSIRFDGQPVTFDGDVHPYYDGEVVMVPVEKTAELLGLDCDKGTRNSIYIESADSSLKLEEASTSYRLNGKRGSLSRPVTMKDGVLYAPVKVFAAMVSKDLVVNGKKIDPKDE